MKYGEVEMYSKDQNEMKQTLRPFEKSRRNHYAEDQNRLNWRATPLMIQFVRIKSKALPSPTEAVKKPFANVFVGSWD